MKKKFLLIGVLIILFSSYRLYVKKRHMETWGNGKVIQHSNSSSIEFRVGDILCRPNWPYLPSSMAIPNGRRYGHVAIVVKGGSGSTVEEALRNSIVIEALLFDQKTKTFLFNSEDQVRQESAWYSFGEKFDGIRYRLRTEINTTQATSIKNFLGSQLGASYNIFSLKKQKSRKNAQQIRRKNWHCATLTWEAFYFFVGLDIDANGGVIIYPSDIIGSSVFDVENGRVCF